MESYVLESVHEHHQRISRHIVSGINNYIRPVRLALAAPCCIMQTYNVVGIPYHQPDVVRCDPVLASRPSYVYSFCQLPRLGGEGSQQPLHFPSAVAVNEHQEPLALVRRATSNIPRCPGRVQTIQNPAPVLVGVSVGNGVRHPLSQLPRLRIGRPPIAGISSQLGDAFDLFFWITHYAEMIPIPSSCLSQPRSALSTPAGHF